MKMCQALAHLGHQVTLLAINNQWELEPGVTDVYKFYNVEKNFDIVKPSYWNVRGKSFFYSPAALKIVQSLQPDLVYGRLIPGCYLTAKSGFHTVVECHTPLQKIKRLEYQSFRKIIKLSSLRKLVVITHALKQHFQEKYPQISEEKILVAHDGSDSVNMTTKNVIDLGRKGHIQIGYVGHLYPGKGMEVIEKIAPELPDFDFHIIGGTEQEISFWKEKLAYSNITFHGFINQSYLTNYLHSLDICLLPNQEEVTVSGLFGINKVNIGAFTSPLKMFDYMAHGKVVVASDIPVLREVLTHQKNAILCSPENASEWIASIRSLRDHHKRTELGAAAKADLESQYTWKKRAAFILENL